MAVSAPEQQAPPFVRQADTTPGTAAAGAWAIRMENIGKQYRLGEVARANDNLREDLTNFFRSLIGRKKRHSGGPQTFWALRDINMEVNRGDTVGIIGRNGAGKSTLLKVLSRITAPTTGQMQYRGRLASLLEVGTGFHRQLSGRENIFLNGSILGMKREEIRRQFDAIVDFAEVEKFLDTPVKFYSSGMYVRLAFAVAAHLRTDILVVDEVLAVGDAAFQAKCLGKMQDVAQDGRTVLFVSHNMTAVQNLCRLALWIKEGRSHRSGDTTEILSSYSKDSAEGVALKRNWPVEEAPGGQGFKVLGIAVSTGQGEDEDLTMATPFQLRVKLRLQQACAGILVTTQFVNSQEIVAFTATMAHHHSLIQSITQPGNYEAICLVPGNLLNSGMYRIRLLIVSAEFRVLLKLEDAVAINVLDNPEVTGGYSRRRPGVVSPILEWRVQNGPD